LLWGGLSIAVLQRSDVAEFMLAPTALYVEVPLLIILTSMFWARWKKLSQIADRWYVLFYLLKQYLGKERAKRFLEQSVLYGFRARRYVRKDAALNFCLCLPIYAIMVTSFLKSIKAGSLICGLLPLALAVFHAVGSFVLLARPMKVPSNLEDELSEA
jgi:hypothetical protein